MPSGLNHVTIAVSDLDKSLSFYHHIISCQPVVRWDKGAYLSLGDLWLCLLVDKPSPSLDYSHIAFSVDQAELEKYNLLAKQGKIKIWKANQSEGGSIYLLDPDGYKLELHCGDLQSRLNSLKSCPYSGLQWLQD
ncbi:glutathione transferase [Aliikangiella marina]|uniref:Glutathione transferase n=1 Tax=Aliikangiella marina TaxID=1712262 RepID=A0A545T2P3_9GAMM|nr:VOC family protein [Aliikangiella marina]TQV71493.1 glutathione transferase [Aliikangiella marina]